MWVDYHVVTVLDFTIIALWLWFLPTARGVNRHTMRRTHWPHVITVYSGAWLRATESEIRATKCVAKWLRKDWIHICCRRRDFSFVRHKCCCRQSCGLNPEFWSLYHSFITTQFSVVLFILPCNNLRDFGYGNCSFHFVTYFVVVDVVGHRCCRMCWKYVIRYMLIGSKQYAWMTHAICVGC